MTSGFVFATFHQKPSCHYKELALWCSIKSDPLEKLTLRYLSSANTRLRACSVCLAGKDVSVTEAVCVLANVGVGQAGFADHLGGTRHRQG